MNPAVYSEAEQSLKTIFDFVRFAASHFDEAELFYGHGTNNAWDEAAYLILHTLNLPPDSPSAIFNSRLIPIEKNKILEKIKTRIEKRCPVAYITNEAWFAGLSFYVDERVLVPRSPIAELIDNEFSPWLDNVQVERIADVCTGSSCIAIALALKYPQATVDALDISDDALAVANINIDRFDLTDQVHAIKSDLLTTVENEKYDLIVSNPPYVDAKSMEALPDEYRHEPALGLEAGEHGLDYVIPLLKQAKNCLNPGGIIVVEVGFSQEALEVRLPDAEFVWLEFEQGGEGVFLLTYDNLMALEI